ncbi:hypothetical protein Gbro_1425 [Gordonia bronchialis DSM 43247]|uniref:Uncharacterized protein n=1 Tax=Gordonia bronchialis (strain ATCC 25592 / DSM 43247 / BCRC 13721 / JCM 3198 / KCTC 3076 / NBRC 16047 / NCTC 10667) TaxID=526226 RepID=D0L6F0_GORB4|nr:hypothetical protein [Gordonia bronchialis]ACY20707.1 hypothetical protein Gbro_1425 [Gordonia bronchialis DSM 43247]MCC3323480.1 hypothetical protein [Gordonia bronchialis]QGS25541.1 hypothetical protein FOB84_16750 [Gordonia bronchialis]STQ63536.1 Uncharacterised protein [Gordonia bronchialis]
MSKADKVFGDRKGKSGVPRSSIIRKERPTRCPACGSEVPESQIDRAKLATNTVNSGVEQAILRRRAHRARQAGDLAEAVAQSELAEKAGNLREQGPDGEELTAREGTDECPACSTTGVKVIDSRLAPSGRAELARSRQRFTTAEVEKARDRKTSASRAAFDRANERRRRRRAALRDISGGGQ